MSFWSWMTTRAGRKFVNSAVTAATGAVVLAKYTPHTFFVDNYADIFHMYKSGFKAPLPDDLRVKFNKCLEILNIPPVFQPKIRPFPVFGLDLFNAGFFDSQNGVVIGIPQTFSYNSTEDIDRDSIQVNLEPVNWSSEAGQRLADSIVFTEREKQFAICREIIMTRTSHVYLDTGYPVVIILCTYFINTTFNQKLQLLKRPLVFRLPLYTLTSLFGLGMYFFTKDFTQVAYETQTDEELCKLGPEFIEAGAGFYGKLLNRNIALRELLGKRGESLYTTFGNESSLIRYKHLPLTVRKAYFDMRLKELREKPHTNNGEEAELVS